MFWLCFLSLSRMAKDRLACLTCLALLDLCVLLFFLQVSGCLGAVRPVFLLDLYRFVFRVP